MSCRRPPRLLTARVFTAMIVWVAVAASFSREIAAAEGTAASAVGQGSLLDDEDPCSIPPELYFRGPRFESSSGSVNVDEDVGDQLLGIDCDDSGSTSDAIDQLLGINCDDESDGTSGQIVGGKNDHHAASSADHPPNVDHDGLDGHDLYPDLDCDSLDASASGDAMDHAGAASESRATGGDSDTSQPPATSASIYSIQGPGGDARTSGALRGSTIAVTPPAPATTAANSTRTTLIHPQAAPDSSVDCEEPLLVPTIDTSPDELNGSNDWEQPLPVPTIDPAPSIHPTSIDSTQDGSDDCEQPLPVPTIDPIPPIRSKSVGSSHTQDGSDECEQPLPVPALHQTPSTPSPHAVAVMTASPTLTTSAAALPTAREPTSRPSTSPNLFLRVSLSPFCAGDATPVSVEGVEGVFCVPGFYICSSHRDDGACPDAQPGLPDGSHCAIVRTGVYGCRPGPRPPPIGAVNCRANGSEPVSVVGVGTFCAKQPVCSGSVLGNCPQDQPGLAFHSRCQPIATGVFGCTA